MNLIQAGGQSHGQAGGARCEVRADKRQSTDHPVESMEGYVFAENCWDAVICFGRLSRVESSRVESS